MKLTLTRQILLTGLCIISLFGIFNIPSYAFNIPSVVKTEQESEVVLENGIKRKEILTSIPINYSLSDSPNTYRYFTLRKDIVYTDRKGNIVASGFLGANFRYNTKFRLAKCLSTYHGQMCSNSKYSLVVIARTKNMSFEVGEAFGLVKLEKNGRRIDYNQYIASCDFTGSVIQR